MGETIEYLNEAGVFYRHLRENESTEADEVEFHYVAYHHPTRQQWTKRVAIVGPSRPAMLINRPSFLNLVNHWNRQPSTGWSYYT